MGGSNLPKEAWAFVQPNGHFLIDSQFNDEECAWNVGLGWPLDEEIEQRKREGYKVVWAKVYV